MEGWPETESTRGGGLSKESARSGLDRIQVGIGILLLFSATAGTYLLLTDGSLWRLALSHALGLIVIVLVDFGIGILSLLVIRRVYLASLAAAALAIVLQLGDIVTAPQYNMSISYFASYLFGLWAFDLLLVAQFVVIVLGVLGRRNAVFLSRRKSRRGKELEYSRRSFVKSLGAFGVLVGFAALLSSIKLPVSSNGSQTTTNTQQGAPTGSVANRNSLVVDKPVYFDYPAGYTNILTLQADGTLLAVSMYCTHVCCELTYDSPSGDLYCGCHGSVFDKSGKVLQGPAYVDLPQIELQTDANGYIFPVGVSNPGPCQV
jgi:arsenite oxidase small subunit